MNKYRRNVVFVGFSLNDRHKIQLHDVKVLLRNESLPLINKRFPHIIFVNTIDEALKHQGFALFFRNDKKISEVARRHRRSLLRKYYHVFKTYKGEKKLRDDYFETYDENALYKFSFLLNFNILYSNYVNEEKRNVEVSAKIKDLESKYDYLVRIKEYLKDKKEVTAKEVAAYLVISLRTAQRYMNKYRQVFGNIRYSGKTKSWIKC